MTRRSASVALAAHPPVQSGDAVARLRTALVSEHRIEPLVAAFAAMLREGGISGHHVARFDYRLGTISPLFGDSPWLLGALEGGTMLDPDAPAPKSSHALTVDRTHLLLLADPGLPDDPAALSRLRGYAAMYVGRATGMFDSDESAITDCGLSLCERFILGRLLVGDSIFEIALRCDRSVTAVAAHIESAIATLGADNRSKAVAIAARQGWLVTMLRDFQALSHDNIAYYS